jgi:hypothetical protein
MSELEILHKSIKFNLPFMMLNRLPPVRNFFVHALLQWLALFSERRAFLYRLWTVVCKLGSLLVVAIQRQAESVVKNRCLRSRCQDIFLPVLCWLVVIFRRRWIWQVVAFLHIWYFWVFSEFLRMLLALRTQLIRIRIACMFHRTSLFVFGRISTLLVIVGVILLYQWMRVLALFNLEKLFSFPWLALPIHSPLLVSAVLILCAYLHFWFLYAHLL